MSLTLLNIACCIATPLWLNKIQDVKWKFRKRLPVIWFAKLNYLGKRWFTRQKSLNPSPAKYFYSKFAKLKSCEKKLFSNIHVVFALKCFKITTNLTTQSALVSTRILPDLFSSNPHPSPPLIYFWAHIKRIHWGLVLFLTPGRVYLPLSIG